MLRRGVHARGLVWSLTDAVRIRFDPREALILLWRALMQLWVWLTLLLKGNST